MPDSPSYRGGALRVDRLATLAAALRHARLVARRTQRDVAEAAGLWIPQLCNFERRRRRPYADQVMAWADALGYDLVLVPRQTQRPGSTQEPGRVAPTHQERTASVHHRTPAHRQSAAAGR